MVHWRGRKEWDVGIILGVTWGMTVLCTKMDWKALIQCQGWRSGGLGILTMRSPTSLKSVYRRLVFDSASLPRLPILERGVVTNAGRDPLLHRRPDPEPSISHLAGLGCNYKGVGVWIVSSLRGSFKDWVKNAQKDCRLYISVPGRNCREVLLSSCCLFPEDLESFWLLHFSSLPYFPPLSEFCFCWWRQGVIM